ncbi:hypothetical protein LLG46_12020 [bacterium]|nr:hypothetical protein [bacterium]
MADYRRAMPYNIDFVIPGFEKSYPAGMFRALSLEPNDCAEWYREFVAGVTDAIGKRYLPVCRLGDGVFVFVLGRYLDPIRARHEDALRYIKRRSLSMLKQVIRPNKCREGFDNNSPWGFGIYTNEEWVELRKSYPMMLREVSKVGFVCPHFTYRDNQFCQQYFIPMTRWFRRNRIELTPQNYYPFYFVYGLLNGPGRSELLGGRRVLVVTSYDDAKARRIEAGLRREDAQDVQFVQITMNRSLYDRIDLSNVKLPVDVVLVAAGLGAVNVLTQLKVTGTLCIDAGYALECIANPERERSLERARTFCWPDFERQGDYTPI